MYNHVYDYTFAIAEQFWEAVFKVQLRKEKANDQIRLNHGLDMLGISWSGNYHDGHRSVMYGQCRNHLTVTVLPFDIICRYGCLTSKRDQYYIWHKGGERDQNSKMAGATSGHTWFLRKDWNSQDDRALKGTNWLYSISLLYNAV